MRMTKTGRRIDCRRLGFRLPRMESRKQVVETWSGIGYQVLTENRGFRTQDSGHSREQPVEGRARNGRMRTADGKRENRTEAGIRASKGRLTHWTALRYIEESQEVRKRRLLLQGPVLQSNRTTNFRAPSSWTIQSTLSHPANATHRTLLCAFFTVGHRSSSDTDSNH